MTPATLTLIRKAEKGNKMPPEITISNPSYKIWLEGKTHGLMEAQAIVANVRYRGTPEGYVTCLREIEEAIARNSNLETRK